MIARPDRTLDELWDHGKVPDQPCLAHIATCGAKQMMIGHTTKRFRKWYTATNFRCRYRSRNNDMAAALSELVSKLAAMYGLGQGLMAAPSVAALCQPCLDFVCMDLVYTNSTGEDDQVFKLCEPFAVELAQHICKALEPYCSSGAVQMMDALVKLEYCCRGATFHDGQVRAHGVDATDSGANRRGVSGTS